MLKRAIQFSIIYWIIIFAIVSVFLFRPFTASNELWQSIGLWITLIPVTLGLARWYFREVDPTPMNGVKLWAVSMITGFVLDSVITIPLFISQEFNGDAMAAFQSFYTDGLLYAGFLWSLLLMVYAGFEFDRAPHLGVKNEAQSKESNS